MEITIRNKIKIDYQEELIKEKYQGELKKGNAQTLLKYQNANNEKVLLKFDENEVVMTRFAAKATKMYFRPKTSTLTDYEGLGELSLFTHSLSIDQNQRTIKIKYQLSQGQQKIADYHLRIDWQEQDEKGEING